MLKTILNLKGVEVLSNDDLKNTNGGSQRCTVPYTPAPYYGPCIMLPPLLPREPICTMTIDGVICE